MGSGTTAIAAMSLKRSYVGMEMEPEYHAHALKRIQIVNNTLSTKKIKKNISIPLTQNIKKHV